MLNKQNVAVLFLSLTMLSAPRAYPDDGEDQAGVQRVLLISIDGMHAVDFENCARNNTCPHLAELAGRGVTYTRASASKPSDSFPGLTNIVTGGTPKTWRILRSRLRPVARAAGHRHRKRTASRRV